MLSRKVSRFFYFSNLLSTHVLLRCIRLDGATDLFSCLSTRGCVTLVDSQSPFLSSLMQSPEHQAGSYLTQEHYNINKNTCQEVFVIFYLVAGLWSRTRYVQVMSLGWFIVVRFTRPQCLACLIFYLQRPFGPLPPLQINYQVIMFMRHYLMIIIQLFDTDKLYYCR